MKIVRLYDILWDTDGEDPTELGLPSEHIAVVDDDWSPVDDAADLLSDQFGFCVKGCASPCCPIQNSPRAASSWTMAA